MRATRKLGLKIVCVLLISIFFLGCDSFLSHDTIQGEENYLLMFNYGKAISSPGTPYGLAVTFMMQGIT